MNFPRVFFGMNVVPLTSSTAISSTRTFDVYLLMLGKRLIDPEKNM
jgi:hypothetical protein